MLSERQFTDAISFIKTYSDALNCVEQIAERRASYEHYKTTTETFAAGIKNDNIKLEGNRATSSANFKDFPWVKMQQFAKNLYQKYGFDSSTSAKDLNARLDKAINELEGKN